MAYPVAAGPSIAPPPVNPIAIIGTQFIAPYPIDLAVTRKDFTITDKNGNIVFKVKGSDRRVLDDAAGNPIVTLKQKSMTAHDRWQVFRGDSKESRDLMFTVKRSSMFQLKTKLEVFLANNTNEDVCDFKVKANLSESSCVVYVGESSTIVAQMRKKDKKFMVTVYPNVDYAFIMTLIVILDGIHSDGATVGAEAAGGWIGEAVGAALFG